MPIETLYDKDYYKNCLGPIPCSWESEEWSGFVKNVANNIKQKYNPNSIIDAGCGIGLLVGAFKDLGVSWAIGFDDSEYAIKEARKHLGTWAVKRNLTSTLPGQAELVTCIEVLEHISKEHASLCISNLCSMAEKFIVFSSSPDDLEEPTHVNVQPESYWLNLFSTYNFEKIDSAPYISPQAIVLQRVKV